MTTPMPMPLIAGKYRLVRMLGRGGMGAVYEAKHEGTERLVAVKLLHPEAARNEGILARFRLEARAAARIAHGGVVEVLDFGEAPEGAYLVMERLEGEALSAFLKGHAKLTAHQAVPLIAQVLETLAAAHAQGIVHRDLKPGNIFLSKGTPPRTKLLDFGISKFQGEVAELTATGMMLGTIVYMAPEQLRDSRNVTAAADMWAIGTILYKALSGQSAFTGETDSQAIARILMEAPSPLRHAAPDVSPALDALVTKLLSKEASGRPNANEARAELEAEMKRLGAPPASEVVTQLCATRLEPEPASLVIEDGTPLLTPPPPKPGELPWFPEGTSQTPTDRARPTVAESHRKLAPAAATPSAPAPTKPSTSRWVLPLVGVLGAMVGLLVLRPSAPPTTATFDAGVALSVKPIAPLPAIDAGPATRVGSVVAEPRTAKLWLDGTPCANPCRIEGTVGARHQVVARAEGFVERSVDVELGDWEEESIALEPVARVTPQVKKAVTPTGAGGGAAETKPPPKQGLELEKQNPFAQ